MWHNVQRYIKQELRLIDRINDNVLDELHVTVIARRQIAQHRCDLVRHRLHTIATRTQHLEHIRVALMRHDA